MNANKKEREMKRRKPEVDEASEFREITQDFTDPKEAIREAISNSIDWGATKIGVSIKEDTTRPDEELIIEINDNGLGLNEERLFAFFNLGHSTSANPEDAKKKKLHKIGYKGHGTKTFFNSRQIDILSNSRDCTVYAIMQSPLHKLMNDQVPEYEYDIETKSNKETYTKITIQGYNQNRLKEDFAHKVLKDYILWFTRMGSVEGEFNILDNKDLEVTLQGLGKNSPEKIKFGHIFAEENLNINKLRKERPADWTKIFAKCWLFPKIQIEKYPGKNIDMVFYIEGDEAKRSYNPMIRARLGKTTEYGTYKVEDRYGLWACKDFIPIKRYNEWLGLGKRMETKYHAFVNCQDFRLTANRGDIGNTPPDLLEAIENTVRSIYEDEIIKSLEYQEYEEYAELEQKYQTAEQEKNDFDRRRKRAKTKKVSIFKGIELLEPSVEMGVVALFNLIYALEPSIFPFSVVDYDTKRGYDALVVRGTPMDLLKKSMGFIEFKNILISDFNHSFDHLSGIICWDSKLSDGEKISDIRDKWRTLSITPAGDDKDYTCYMLISPKEAHNIEVFVLKYYLKEILGIEFKPRKVVP